MNDKTHPNAKELSRRNAIKILAGTAIATTSARPLWALSNDKEPNMSQAAFVYTELQISVPFQDAPWQAVSDDIRQQPGFINKTWLSGISNASVGGFYMFDSVENAQKFVTGYFPREAANFGVAHTTRIFPAGPVQTASIDLNSPHFGAAPTTKPGAFVYTELQINVPFENAPWEDRNPVLRAQPGLIAKTWLSGLHTQTLDGLDAFDTIENAQAFAIETFPKTASRLNAALYTRVFDANLTEEASRYMDSPYYV